MGGCLDLTQMPRKRRQRAETQKRERSPDIVRGEGSKAGREKEQRAESQESQEPRQLKAKSRHEWKCASMSRRRAVGTRGRERLVDNAVMCSAMSL